MSYTANLSSPSLFTLSKLGAIKKQQTAITSDFYLSFEDALWQFIESSTFESKNVFLPSFFCTDVSSRITQRGFNIVYYSLDENLKFNQESFLKLTKDKIFAFVIIYYPMGMKDSVPDISWFRDNLGEKIFIIEDYADSLLSEDEVKIIDKRHIAIDSLRKLLPIQGARIWHSKLFCKPTTFNTYALKTFIFWNLTRAIGCIFDILKISLIDNVRWDIFCRHSDLIGSSKEPCLGFKLDRFILNYICVETYKSLRSKVIDYYLDSFSSYSFDNPWGVVKIADLDKKNVRFVIFRGPKGALVKLSDQLEQHGISTDTHFDDSPMGMQYDFLLLPSSLNINKNITDKIASICFNFYSTYNRL